MPYISSSELRHNQPGVELNSKCFSSRWYKCALSSSERHCQSVAHSRLPQSSMLFFNDCYSIQMTSVCGSSFCYSHATVLESMREVAYDTTQSWPVNNALWDIMSTNAQPPPAAVRRSKEEKKDKKSSTSELQQFSGPLSARVEEGDVRNAPRLAISDDMLARKCCDLLLLMPHTSTSSTPCNCIRRFTTATGTRRNPDRQFRFAK